MRPLRFWGLYVLWFSLLSLLGANGQAQSLNGERAQPPALQSNPLQTGAFTKEVRLADIVAAQDLAGMAHIYAAEQSLLWHIYVPPDYTPTKPAGLFVYISPSTKADPPRPWRSVLAKKNYIYVSAGRAGNKVPANQRILNALLAVQYMNANYALDESRTLISGFSGGARIASIIVESAPGIFEEAVLMGGAIKSQTSLEALGQKLEGGAYVFITGRKDQARDEMKASYAQYKKAGLTRLKFIDERNIGHELPKSRILRRALDFLSF